MDKDMEQEMEKMWNKRLTVKNMSQGIEKDMKQETPKGIE